VWLLAACTPRPGGAAKAPPAPASVAPQPSTSAATVARAPAGPATDTLPGAAHAEWPIIVYRRQDDSTLVDAGNRPLAGPLPADYVVVPRESAPASFALLMRRHRAVFVPSLDSKTCKKRVFNSVGTTRAVVHDDEQLGDACLARYSSRLEYVPASFGEAYIEEHSLGEPRILKGCAGVGFGIALCGEPVYLVVAADQDHVAILDTRGHLGGNIVFHAYAKDALIEWFFDAKRCEAASKALRKAGCDG
jgi:hypothetical protein